MGLTGLNRFKPGTIWFMPAGDINAFNFSQFKPVANPGLFAKNSHDLTWCLTQRDFQ